MFRAVLKSFSKSPGSVSASVPSKLSLKTTSRQFIRHASSKPSPQSRVERINARLPRFARRYTTALVTAPVHHIASFLVLHELTAIIPLIGLFSFFHYTQWLPPFVAEWKWTSDGIDKFDRYFKRKGWIKDDDDTPKRGWRKYFGRTKSGVNIVVEAATAWALVKCLLIPRIIFSVWAAPWFATAVILPMTGLFRRKGVKVASAAGVKNAMPSPAAGTGATGGGVLPKN